MLVVSYKPSVVLDSDSNTGVLYAKLEGARISNSRESPEDDYLILNEDAEGQVVGVQVLHASEMVGRWPSHPGRGGIPISLMSALDGWFKAFDMGSKDTFVEPSNSLYEDP
jgi:hypothetical protein